MSILLYRRPSYVDRPSGVLNKTDCQRYVERTKGRKSNIPDRLSFESVIEGKSLPPCSLQDFMDYLVYVAHDAENLQFYLWLRDYTARFEALKPEEQNLSPEWKGNDDAFVEANEETRNATRRSTNPVRKLSTNTAPAIARTRESNAGQGLEDISEKPEAGATDFESFMARSARSQKTTKELTEEANASAGLKWQGFSIQPFRNEITKVITHYIAQGSPRELNISHRDRTAVLHALQHTTHPSAFLPATTLILATLKGQAHPNFIRWSICNGNKPKIFFVRSMGVFHTIAGILIAILLTLSSVSRWWRILPAIITFPGIVTLVAAYKGLCIILHASGKTRNLRPWEDESGGEMDEHGSWRHSEENTLADAKTIHTGALPTSKDKFSSSSSSSDHSGMKFRRSVLQPFGNTNKGFEVEPWVARYRSKPVLRKVFERNTWVQDESVRMIQDRIILQSQIWGLLLTVVITVVFCALPAGNFY